MNGYTVLDALGMIDDDMITGAKKHIHRSHHRLIKQIAAVAAAIVVIAGTLPTATAFGSNTAYQMLHSIAPAIAQTFVPVRQTVIYDGIELQVLYVSLIGNEVIFDISLRDTESSRITADTDLFDSYYVYTGSRFDSISHCKTVSFDKNSKTVYYQVSVTRSNGTFSPGEKITFGFSQYLPNRQKYEGRIDDIDISRDIPFAVNTQTIGDDLRVNGGGGEDYPSIDPYDLEYLVPGETAIAVPAEKCSITGVGYIDGYLHIQQFYEDNRNSDTHGYVWLKNKTGSQITENFSVHYSANGSNGQYSESFFKIDADDLKNYELYGYFVSGDPAVHGEWQISFELNSDE